MEYLKEYSKKTAEEFLAALTKISLKEDTGSGTFEVIASTQSVDRQGEVILLEGWDLKNYMNNPVILFGHDYWSLPIGKATDVSIENGQLIVKGVFASTEFAQEVRKLYDEGILKTVSVGFIPMERQGNVITKAELLELSFVPVPANPDALSLRKMQEVEEMLKTVAASEVKTEEPEFANIADLKVAMRSLLESDATVEEKQAAYDKLAVFYKQFEQLTPELKSYTLYELDTMFGTEKAIINVSIKDFLRLEGDVLALLSGFKSGLIADAVPTKAEKSGRVLSTKNRTAIQNAVEALQAVLDLADDEKSVSEDELQGLIKCLQTTDKSIENMIVKAKAAWRK